MFRNICAPAMLALLLPVMACAAEPKPQSEEWTSLFDGETLGGWEMIKLDPQNDSTWAVEDGVLVGRGEASMLYSPEGDYKNFRFRAEISINDGGNSGMYFRSEKGPSFTGGYECQINSTHRDPIKTGSIYTRVHVYEELVPPDTWFTQEVEVKDVDYRGKVVTSITVKVNDTVLYELLDYDRQYESGHFAFQGHDPGSVVKIRKVEVMELPSN
ncbi:3-keto-disaccharide hydrolase [Tautonia plasticadhaerens]|uniref:3-keto-alpha-glucoside-1,2-lyase/3-keto-2-hydroxy-glucal hydratase domain-containing protein n=1 Tax=Tautonia plasticadhaerens TaxID=2527974 RepID=A0A518H101_9BACT|nr:DUF1080 domain-containing protein [Tautonia plasticadhaerens]QDV34524.1 hypothetical protein ElP_24140 [Tautonia plasticadhaerens]